MMGGMFARHRHPRRADGAAHTGRGQRIRSALFENNAFLVVAAHGAVRGHRPGRRADAGAHLVLGDLRRVRHRRRARSSSACVTDTQWRSFCEAFELGDLAADATLATNPQRVAARDRLLPRLREVFGKLTRDEIGRICEAAAVGYAPITRPEELFGDPQLKRPGAMVEVTLADGRTMPIPALPLEMNGERFGMRLDIPQAGEHSAAIATELGCSADEIRALIEEGVLGVGADPQETSNKPAKAASA